MLKMTTFATSSDGNMFLLENEETKILVECGLDKKEIRRKLMGKNMLVVDLDCCFITHIHQDHCKSVEYIADYTDVYSNIEVASKYECVKFVEPLKPITIKTITVMPILVEHGIATNYAYIFKDKDEYLFFGTDFCVMKQNLKKIKFDKIYIELNYDDEIMEKMLEENSDNLQGKNIRQISTHMSRENCKEHLRHMDLSKCKEIHLLHLSKFLTNKKEIQEDFEREFGIKTYVAC